MKKEKHSAVKKLRSIHDILEKENPGIGEAKKQVRELANELDAYQACFGEPECDAGETIPEP